MSSSLPFWDFRGLQGFSEDLGFWGGGLESPSMVLDGKRGQVVGKKGGGGVSEARAAMALKSHSEAERRRRERINSHLSTLRSLLPCSDKLEKAALLAKVISHVKELKSNTTEISKGCTIPSDVDEVMVETTGDPTSEGSFSITASLCCEDHPELLAYLKQALQKLPLKTVRAEISTLGGRVKNVFVMAYEGSANDVERHMLISTVREALNSILDRISSPQDFSPRTSFSGKRRRILQLESSSSSS